MSKTTLIHNGSSTKGKLIIEKLLSANNSVDNSTKNKVICIDTPESVYKLQEFLAFDEFVFFANYGDFQLNIKEEIIDEVIVVETDDNV